MFVRHDKTKTADNTVSKLGTVILHHDISPTMNIRSKGQKVTGSQSAKGDRVTGVSYALYQMPMFLFVIIIIIIIIIKNENIRVTLCENAGTLNIVNKPCVDGQRKVQG